MTGTNVVTAVTKDATETVLLLLFRQLSAQQKVCEVARLEGMVAVLNEEKDCCA